jgi:hypothetical protein
MVRAINSRSSQPKQQQQKKTNDKMSQGKGARKSIWSGRTSWVVYNAAYLGFQNGNANGYAG